MATSGTDGGDGKAMSQGARSVLSAASPLLAPLALALVLGACETVSPSVALYGAETTSADGIPRPVPARATRQLDGTVYLELAATDGAVFRGPLSYVVLPTVPSVVYTAPVAGGGKDLAGTVASDAGEALECRLALMDGERGVYGGGTGACTGPSRRVDFRF